MVTRKSASEKQEHRLSLHIQVSGAATLMRGKRCPAGAMTALTELKLSRNAQFQDRPGACKLIETAVSRGDLTMAPRLSECRAN
jgi:hypothetical protein